MTNSVLLVELNEINFDFVAAYGRNGKLPNLNRLIARHGVSETTSEARPENVEPWIQWVTAHTGLSFSEHQVFRLGDIVQQDIPQIWEKLEARGLRVGAISPMNAKNRTRLPAFFFPDPWTATRVDGSYLQRQLHKAIAQVVNDNAAQKITPVSVFWLGIGALGTARSENYAAYAVDILKSRSRPWLRSLVLDRLLSDLFVREVKRTAPHFASLFLNAGAHIQHHYMFSSNCYDGLSRNPSWYISDSVDPVLDVLELYDRIIGQIQRSLPEYRLMIATGLHQIPHEKLTYYWRISDQNAFLKRIGVEGVRASPRMSRDFHISCASQEHATRVEKILSSIVVVKDSEVVFDVDNRGSDLFVTLVYDKEIEQNTAFRVGNEIFPDLRTEVVFVAVKNGEHDPVGYFLDTGAPADGRFPLTQLPGMIEAAVT